MRGATPDGTRGFRSRVGLVLATCVDYSCTQHDVRSRCFLPDEQRAILDSRVVGAASSTTIQLDKALTPGIVLAIRIIGITSSLQANATSTPPPTAFARIIAWSHGQVSVDTSSLSEWGSAKPVFLPIGAAAGAVTELEISL